MVIDAARATHRLARPEELFAAAANGRMIILVDSGGTVNSADLIIPAQFATPDAVNFMATHGRGLVSLALTQARIEELQLPPMKQRNRERSRTAFTVSIEARTGVTTGISAADRARTIAVAADPSNGADALVTPGHIFPLAARDGGVLVRAGHTEASIDIVRLAGLNPAAVICQIMGAGGELATLDAILDLAQMHDLPIGSISDLIAYRRRFDNLLDRVGEENFYSECGGDWRLIRFRNKVDGSDILALQKGKVDPSTSTLVRLHHVSTMFDLLGVPGPRAKLLQRAMLDVAKEGSGVIVLLPPPFLPAEPPELRRDRLDPLKTFGIGAQILAELGVHDMIVLSNSELRPVRGIDAFDLNIVGRRALRAGRPNG